MEHFKKSRLISIIYLFFTLAFSQTDAQLEKLQTQLKKLDYQNLKLEVWQDKKGFSSKQINEAIKKEKKKEASVI